MAKKVKFGTVYLDRRPMKPGFNYGGTSICPNIVIGNSGDKDVLIPWVVDRDRYICAKTLVNNINKDQIGMLDFAPGRPVWIDGTQFLCRLIRVGVQDGFPNEWQEILARTGRSACTWTTDTHYSWAEDASGISKSAIFGGSDLDYQTTANPHLQDINIGFRPVLDTLYHGDGALLPPVGMRIKILNLFASPIIPAIGTVVECTDYDLVIEGKTWIPDPCWSVVPNGNKGSLIIAKRDSVMWARD